MQGHKTYLKMGDAESFDLISLLTQAHELRSFSLAFRQDTDKEGDVTSKVYGGTIQAVLTTLSPNDITEWMLDSRKYQNGVLITLDGNQMPIEKIQFKTGRCIGWDFNYALSGESYATTELIIQSEQIVFEDGSDFDNEWTR